MFNHESPRRGNSFVTKKIVESIANISDGTQKSFRLGNLDARRDWGYAKEYVEAMWLMLQQDEPLDLVIATGETYPVREFVEKAFQNAGRSIYWEGSGINEVGKCSVSDDILVTIDPYYFRPTEVDILQGNPSKAQNKIGWKAKTKFNELVKIMMKFELSKINKKESI